MSEPTDADHEFSDLATDVCKVTDFEVLATCDDKG